MVLRFASKVTVTMLSIRNAINLSASSISTSWHSALIFFARPFVATRFRAAADITFGRGLLAEGGARVLLILAEWSRLREVVVWFFVILIWGVAFSVLFTVDIFFVYFLIEMCRAVH
jgi:hypothetical protein